MATVKRNNITMSKGNLKFAPEILIWSIPAIKTCPNCADCAASCYARKAEKVYPQVLPCRERNYQATQDLEQFKRDMVALIKRTQKTSKKHTPSAVRIHESGDFYSKEYAEAWAAIARECPELTFYGHTKAPENLPEDIPENMNIVESILPNGEVNFGSKEKVLRMSKEYGAAICPYGKAKKAFKCGTDCKACMRRSRVVFIEH